MEWTRWNQTRLALLLRDFRNTEGLRKTLRRSESDPPTWGPGHGDDPRASTRLQNGMGRETGRNLCRAVPPRGDHEPSDRRREGHGACINQWENSLDGKRIGLNTEQFSQ